MKQISFSQVEYAGKKRTTRREEFLAEMEQVMPWSEVLGGIEPHYPKGKAGSSSGGTGADAEGVSGAAVVQPVG